jgi:predicted phosphodiesterase
MRIAVISDIHGNIAALEAVLDDIARRDIAAVLCLGDCASGMMWPGETTALLMAHGIPSVRGNHDRFVAHNPPEGLKGQDAFAYKQTTAEQRAWLGALPTRITPAPGVLACHGTPDSDVVNLLEEARVGHLVPAPWRDIRDRLGEAGMAARVVLCGHSHQVSVVQLPEGGPLIVNPGSLGLPAFRVGKAPNLHKSEARAPHARYAVLHLPADAPPSAETIALPYDWESAARRAEAQNAPAWAYALRTGYIPDHV